MGSVAAAGGELPAARLRCRQAAAKRLVPTPAAPPGAAIAAPACLPNRVFVPQAQSP